MVEAFWLFLVNSGGMEAGRDNGGGTDRYELDSSDNSGMIVISTTR